MNHEAPVPSPLLIHEAAEAMARKFGLINHEGQVECIKGCGRLAQLPSLCCEQCLAWHRRGYR